MSAIRIVYDENRLPLKQRNLLLTVQITEAQRNMIAILAFYRRFSMSQLVSQWIESVWEAQALTREYAQEVRHHLMTHDIRRKVMDLEAVGMYFVDEVPPEPGAPAPSPESILPDDAIREYPGMSHQPNYIAYDYAVAQEKKAAQPVPNGKEPRIGIGRARPPGTGGLKALRKAESERKAEIEDFAEIRQNADSAAHFPFGKPFPVEVRDAVVSHAVESLRVAEPPAPPLRIEITEQFVKEPTAVETTSGTVECSVCGESEELDENGVCAWYPQEWHREQEEAQKARAATPDVEEHDDACAGCAHCEGEEI